MPNQEIENQYPLQPDYTPVKKVSKFRVWFSWLTPRKKWLVWLALALVAVAVGVGLYFLLAAGERYYFEPNSGNWEVNSTHNIRVYVDDPDDGTINGIRMKIGYTDIFDPNNEDIQITASYPDSFKQYVADPLSDPVDRANNSISVETKNNMQTIDASGPVLVLEITVTVPDTVAPGTLFKLLFSRSNNDNIIYSGGVGSPAITPRLEDASFTISDGPQGIIGNTTLRLSPDSGSLSIGDYLDINVLANSDDDIVAIGAEIDYDPQYFEVRVLDSPTFPVIGEEKHDTANGLITLVRGTYGNGAIDDGTATPETDSQGFRGSGGVVAALQVRAVNVTDPNTTPITITNAEFVLDNGAGDLVTLTTGQINGGTYTITEEQPLPQTPYITEQSYSCSYVTGQGFKLTVNWQTNVDATSGLTASSGIVEPDSGGYKRQHTMNVNGVDETGTYQIGGESRDNDPINPDGIEWNYDCAYATGPLEIKDLVITPTYNSAEVVFMTVGGNSQGLANSQVTQLEVYNAASKVWTPVSSYTVSPTNTSAVNIHRFNVNQAPNGLAGNTRYRVTVHAVDPADSSNGDAETMEFVTLEDSGARPTNVVLKVNRDRVCDNWLYCKSSVQVTNTKGRVENLCFDVGLCNRLDGNGNCISAVELGQQGITGGNQTFISPRLAYSLRGANNKDEAYQAENKFKNLSGLSKVGMKWGYCSVSVDRGCLDDSDCPNGETCRVEDIEGYKHYTVMSPLGKNVNIPNGDFELGDSWPWLKNGAAEISAISDIYSPGNKVLQVALDPHSSPQSRVYVGARAPLGELSSSAQYVISFDARSQSQQGKILRVQARTWDGSQWIYSDLITDLKIGQGFQRVVKKIDRSLPTGYTELLINQVISDNPQEEFEKAFYLDNVSMQPVLHVQNKEGNVADDKFVARSCRMYPSTNAPECDYTDQTGGKYYGGWKGFCVEEDPGYSNMCLNWWPVDIIPGETDIFGSDPQVGYKDRKPLYFCLESAGNYPLVRKTRSGRADLNEQTGAVFYRGIKDCEDDSGRNCGWHYASGRATAKVPDEIGLRLVDIEKIILKPVCDNRDEDKHCFSKQSNEKAYLALDRSNNWRAYMCSGGNCASDYEWRELMSTNGIVVSNSQCQNEAADIFAIQAVFKDGKFIGLQGGLCNWTGQHDDYGFVRYDVYFYLREPCNVLAKVVDPYAKNYAWASRVLPNGWNENNYLGYEYKQDYAPYGAAVPPPNVNHPDQWTEPLYVMPPDTTFGMSPYQIRAGSPYAINIDTRGTNVQRYCSNSDTECVRDSDCTITGADYGSCDEDRTGYCEIGGNLCTSNANCTGYEERCVFENHCSGNPSLSCTTDSDCQTADSTGICQLSGDNINKIDIGQRCIAGSADKLDKACRSNADCGFGLDGQTGLCMGINLTDEQQKKIIGDYHDGINRLSQLFAKSLETWQWHADANRYMLDCRYDDKSTSNIPDLCWDKRDVYGQRPEVRNITINGRGDEPGNPSDIHLYGSRGVSLKFNAFVNENQLPLVAYRVDWGDESGITEVTNLNIAPRTQPSNPHVMLHTYTCPAGGGSLLACSANQPNNCWDASRNACIFKPRVQIEDNWEVKSEWTEFEGEMIVEP